MKVDFTKAKMTSNFMHARDSHCQMHGETCLLKLSLPAGSESAVRVARGSDTTRRPLLLPNVGLAKFTQFARWFDFHNIYRSVDVTLHYSTFFFSAVDRYAAGLNTDEGKVNKSHLGK